MTDMVTKTIITNHKKQSSTTKIGIFSKLRNSTVTGPMFAQILKLRPLIAHGLPIL